MPAEMFKTPAAVEDVVADVTRIKSIITDAVEDGVKSALSTIKEGRHAAEDALDDAKHAVKQNPFEAVGIAFGAGIVMGAFAVWLGRRSR